MGIILTSVVLGRMSSKAGRYFMYSKGTTAPLAIKYNTKGSMQCLKILDSCWRNSVTGLDPKCGLNVFKILFQLTVDHALVTRL